MTNDHTNLSNLIDPAASFHTDETLGDNSDETLQVHDDMIVGQMWDMLSEQALDEVWAQAIELELLSTLVVDEGLTDFWGTSAGAGDVAEQNTSLVD